MSLANSLNCSDTSRLRILLTQLLNELAQANSTSPSTDNDTDDAYLYILLIMIFYACLAGGLILAYTRSRKVESKNDPYHMYIEREWAKQAKNLQPQNQCGSIESEQLL
ncbi:potassium voltage-gated channel subfamily E regulatory beta subunit 5 [Pelobates cultripes]|uniref:Potassium voltage-gated channel subfamily E regulatory beta subunit 5 n=1 Tax=Pelobates cultripes TaxID=61616 RepID=A0AAD1T524_PELCU|nr:potassium voltage-gated channel subfamily E regulatory beta subunit 5 [Pelobates cultripes]